MRQQVCTLLEHTQDFSLKSELWCMSSESGQPATVKPKRPRGITVIGIMNVIGGPFAFFVGVCFVLLIPNMDKNPEAYQSGLWYLTGWLGYPVAVGITLMGIGSTIAGAGLLKGKQWAWKLTIGLSFMGIAHAAVLAISKIGDLFNVVNMIISVVIDVIILYYLYRPSVKAYFGKMIPSVNTTGTTNQI